MEEQVGLNLMKKLSIRLVFIGLLVILVSSCKVKQAAIPNFSELPPRIQSMLNDRALSKDSLKIARFTPEKYAFDEFEVERNRYEYFSKGAESSYTFLNGQLLMIIHTFWGFRDSIKDNQIEDLQKILGPEKKVLPTSIGDDYWEYVYPDLGISFIGKYPEKYYDHITVFFPMSLRRYKRYIWRNPADIPDTGFHE